LKKLKVVTIVGTRPEIIRLSRLIPKLDEFTNHILVHTGQNYDRELSEVFFDELNLREPDYFLNVDTSSFGSVMGETLKKSEEVLLKEKPDAVMILGDTNSSIAAIVAERLHIPVYHMEAGNRSFDHNVPEELNRRMIDHVATFNLPYSEHARQNLISEGLHPRFILKTGSPIGEVYNFYRERIESSNVLERLQIQPNNYFLVSIHRQENVDSPDRLVGALNALSAVQSEWKIPVLVSTHPRTHLRLSELEGSHGSAINFHKPFGYLDYCNLQMNARCVISDSGTISEESSVMGFPAVTLRDSMERPEALESGSIIMSGMNPSNLKDAINLAVNLARSERPTDYEVVDFSDRVLKLLVSTATRANTWRTRRAVVI
jgi:UDP-N-acetyl-L-fucosamine synthase